MGSTLHPRSNLQYSLNCWKLKLLAKSFERALPLSFSPLSYFLSFSIQKFRERSVIEKDLPSHVPGYHCKWVNFGCFAKAWHGKFFPSGFLLFLELKGANEYYSFPKDQERTTLPSTTSDQQRARFKRKNICKPNGGTRWCELES